MRTRLTAVLLLALAVAGPLQAQLYLIAGTPNPKGTATFISALLRVNDDGTVKSVAELVPEGVATESIAISHDWSPPAALPDEHRIQSVALYQGTASAVP